MYKGESVIATTIVKRITSIVLVLALATAVAVVPLAVADLGASDSEPGTPEGESNTSETDHSTDELDEDLTPGEQFAGVVGVQRAELNGEISEHAYGIEIASAQSDAARADVANEQIADVDDRLDELEAVHEELDAAYENGEISYGQYRAQVAITAAEQRTAERVANNTATAVEQLDDELVAEHDIDVDEIHASATRAAEPDTDDISAIVRSVVGDHVGQPFASDQVEPLTEETNTSAANGTIENETDVDVEEETDVDVEEETDIDLD